MGWLIGIVAGFFFLVLLFRFPLQTIGLIALIVGGIWFWLDTSSRQYNASLQRSRTLVSPSQVELTSLYLRSSYSMWSLSGNVKNNSPRPINALEVTVQVVNCPNDQCVTVGEDTQTIYVRVPPGQMRQLSSSFSLYDMPTLDNWRWYYTLNAVRAE